MFFCRYFLLAICFVFSAVHPSNAGTIEIPSEVYDYRGGMDGNGSLYKSHSTGQIASCIHNNKFSTCSDAWVCYGALEGSFTTFTNPPKFNGSWIFNNNGSLVAEAKKRGFNENSCLKTLLEFSPNKSKKVKNTHSAKSQGLTTPVYKLNDPLKKAFTSLSSSRRKLIQSKLFAEGYYKSSIDGLYGRGTEMALTAYNKDFLSDATLTVSANVEALLNDVIKTKSINGNPNPKVKVKLNLGNRGLNVELESGETVQAKEPVKPSLFNFAQVKAAYDAGNYSQAFKDAQILSIEGDPDAQLYLGKMYADGRGTLQISTTAHMWFNIATLNGSAEAFEERQKITLIMTPSAVEEAQKMAMTCIQSSYRDCGLSVKPITISKPQEYAQPTAEELQRYFRALSTLERKQVQYALKKLGYYQSGVDGLYGRGTKTALENYLSEAKSIKYLSQVYAELTSQVQVPTAFAAPKRTSKTTTSSTTKITAPYGWRLVTNNPIHSYEQADAICKPMSQNAGNSVRMPNTNNNYNCYGSGNSFNCNNNASSPEAAFINGLARGMMKSKTRRRAYASCMAQYGWVED